MPTRQTADYDPMMDELPPELAAEYMAEKRRRKISEAMMGQSQTPLVAPEVKGRFQGAISPWQGIAKIAEAYMANKGLEGSDAAMADIGKRNQEAYTSDIDRISKVMTGRPEQPMGPPTEAGEMGISPAVPAGSAEQVAQAMMASRFPSISKHGFGQLDAAQKQKQVAIDKLDQIEAAAREGRITREEAAIARASAEKIARAENAANREAQIRIAASLRPARDEGAPVAVVGPDGKAVLVSRKDSIGKTPIASDPESQAAMATAKGNAKLSAGLPQARLRVESMSQNLDRLDNAMSALHDNPDLSRITGTIMGRTPNITNEATGAQTDLNSIKSQIFQSSLQAMREASKTGGAVGNVSDKEGDKLERTLSGLDQSAGTPKFKENLKKAIEQVRISKSLIRNAFDEQYGGVNEPQDRRATDKPAGGGLTPQEQQELSDLRKRLGR